MTYDYNFWIILSLACLLAYTATQLMRIRKQVHSARLDMRGMADEACSSNDQHDVATGKMFTLLRALEEYEAASDTLNAPQIKRLSKENPKRVGAQGKFDHATKILIAAKKGCTGYLQEHL